MLNGSSHGKKVPKDEEIDFLQSGLDFAETCFPPVADPIVVGFRSFPFLRQMVQNLNATSWAMLRWSFYA